MKFLALATLALVRAEEEPVEDGTDCSTESTVCLEGSCCGTASLAGEGSLTICNVADSDSWSNDENDYSFACNPEPEAAEEERASTLALTGVTLMGLIYTLA